MKRFLLLAAGLFAAAQCAARPVVVRVGLSEWYTPVQQRRAAERCPDKDVLCYRYTIGSEYQLLDWLQTGRIDAAALSGLTVALLQRGVGAEKFKQEFFVGAKLPLNDLEPRRYRVEVRAKRKGMVVQDADAALREVLGGMAGPEPADALIELPSHLSAAVLELHKRAGPSDPVMKNLVGRLRFGEDSSGAALRFTLAEVDGGPLSHFFVLRRLALPASLEPGRSPQPGLKEEKDFLDYLAGARKRVAPESEFGRFAAGNYKRERAGWRNRYRFEFSLEELNGILRSHVREAQEDTGIALVLTGGGVKAAYQTKLIDHLYGGGYLYNRLAPPQEVPAHALPVNYVVGTSGGALLGIFVASLDGKKAHPDLSTKLWHKEGDADKRVLSAADVFPWADMMRWASLLYCAFIFGVVCVLASLGRRLFGNAPAGTADEAGGRFAYLTLWWLALLVATPWLLVHLNGKHGAEHIPAIQGAFYGLFVLIAVYSDNRFIVTKARFGVANPRPSPWPPALAGAAGLALVGAAVIGNSQDPTIVPFMAFTITLPALVACFGVTLVFLALQWWFERCAPRLKPVSRQALDGIVLLTLLFVVSHGMLCVLALFGYATTFELILVKFWGVLGVIALAVSILVACFAFVRPRSRLGRLFDFFLEPHPSQGLVNVARGTRMIGCAIAGWLWWNLLVAPGLYGNQDAFDYFKRVAKQVFPDAVDDRGPGPLLKVQFNAHYVAPVTDLEDNAEHYVMFRPAQVYATGASDAGLGKRSAVAIANDPRWLTIENEEQQAKLLMRVAFASGSPFPVFPAHRIELPVIREKLLVDGGYAHNVPVEAAKRLGARRVLVVNSSPREPPDQPGLKPANGEPKFQYLGNFALMLRFVLPYLYNRSQVEDAVSGEDLLLASIAPSGNGEDWPFLTDFRAEVVGRMFDEAGKDRKLRIGTIDNWGQPSFAPRPASATPARGSPAP
jgi:predicted acylesterase/phospholipase RssA